MTRQLQRLIHVGCRELGLDTDTRRDMQLHLVGKASLSEMTEAELTAVLDGLKARGFRPRAGKGAGRGGFRHATRRDVRLIFVMWRALGDAGKLRDPSPAGLHAFVARRFGQAWGFVPVDINTLTDPDKIEAVLKSLKDWIHRENVPFDWGRIGK